MNLKKNHQYIDLLSLLHLLLTGIIIGSGTKLKDNIVPLINWEKTTNKIKKPNKECTSWKATVKTEKYFIKLPKFKLK